MTPNELNAFLAVADSGSFSRAAERLHITQPAVSKRIRALEAELGGPLFDRVGKRVYLTAAGELLKPRAAALVHDMADIRRLLQTLDSAVAGRLSLATSHHVGLHRLAPVLKAFTQQYPEVQLDMRFEDSEAAHELVRRAESDMAVVTLDPEGPAGLDYLPVWDDPLCFVVAADHPLAGRGPVTLEALAGHAAVLPGPATYTGRIVLGTFARRGVPLRPELSTNFLETIGMLVAAGLGWSVLPERMVGSALAALETDAPPLGRTLGCVTHPKRTLSNAALAFREVLTTFRDPVAGTARAGAG